MALNRTHTPQMRLKRPYNDRRFKFGGPRFGGGGPRGTKQSGDRTAPPTLAHYQRGRAAAAAAAAANAQASNGANNSTKFYDPGYLVEAEDRASRDATLADAGSSLPVNCSTVSELEFEAGRFATVRFCLLA